MRVWKKIKRWHYKVSNLGEIKSLPKVCKGKNNSQRIIPGRILKYGIDGCGYLNVTLYKDKRRKTFLVHLLVLEYFGPPKPSLIHECNHKDGDKQNPRIDNLEWCTSSENSKHAYNNKLQSAKGENNSQSKLTKRKVKWIRTLYKTGKYTQKELGGMFGVTRQHIGKIVNRKAWL